MKFPSPAAHDRDVAPLLDECTRFVEPTMDQNTVAVDKLDEASIWIERPKSRKTYVPCPRCSKGPGQIQCNNMSPDLFRGHNTAVGRTGVDVHDIMRFGFHRC